MIIGAGYLGTYYLDLGVPDIIPAGDPPSIGITVCEFDETVTSAEFDATITTQSFE